MAFTIQSSASPTSGFIAPTGRPNQQHLIYAVNQGAYWVFYLSGTQVVNALYSTNNGITWDTPSGSPFTLAQLHSGESRNFGFTYLNKSSTDILHMSSSYINSNEWLPYQSRFTLGAVYSNTNVEAIIGIPLAANAQGAVEPSGTTVALDSTGIPHVCSSAVDSGSGFDSGFSTIDGLNVDSGSSWTAGFGTLNTLGTVPAWVTSGVVLSLVSGKVLAIADNAISAGGFTNLTYAIYSGSTWGASANILATSVTQADTNAYGAVARTTSDIHIVALSNNNNTYVHRRFNGTTWSNGDVIGNLVYHATSGISLISDGISVWAAVIDSSKNIQVNQWQAGLGWSGWNTQEIRTNVPSYITGAYSGSQIMWAWSEVNGSNFDIIGTTYNIQYPGPFTVSLPNPDSLNYPCKQVAAGWV